MRSDITTFAGEPSVNLRFRLTSDNVVNFEGYTIDQVKIFLDPADPARACRPIQGGVVAGYVSDSNTAAPLTGATVTSETGVVAETFAIPEAPIEGFYWLFQPTASDPEEISFTAYQGRVRRTYSTSFRGTGCDYPSRFLSSPRPFGV